MSVFLMQLLLPFDCIVTLPTVEVGVACNVLLYKYRNHNAMVEGSCSNYAIKMAVTAASTSIRPHLLGVLYPTSIDQLRLTSVVKQPLHCIPFYS